MVLYSSACETRLPVFQGAANQFHLFFLEYFLPKRQSTPANVLDRFSLLFLWGGGVTLLHVLLKRFFQSLLLFCSLLFILQSKEYPRNVPENPTRKYVEKEVCKQANIGAKYREESDWYVLSRSQGISPSTARSCVLSGVENCCIFLST